MEKQIDKLTQLGTDAVQSAIRDYTTYFIYWSAGWIIFGLCCGIAAKMIWDRRDKWEDDDEVSVVVKVTAMILLSLICATTLPLNLPTLLQPRAYAIHQLIQDAAQ